MHEKVRERRPFWGFIRRTRAEGRISLGEESEKPGGSQRRLTSTHRLTSLHNGGGYRGGQGV